MESMTLEEVRNAVKGKILDNNILTIKGISTDSRTISKGELYIPIKGERFDGHDFIDDAIKNGAIAYLTERQEDSSKKSIPILVENTLKAFHDLAFYYRRKFDIPLIGITGSSGKTTTKDILASVLEQNTMYLKLRAILTMK